MGSKIKLKLFFLSALISVCLSSFAQQKITSEEYIIRYSPVAMEKMREYKIPASITLAQGLLESGNGNSALATKANNHFGIKCHKGWEGATYTMDDDEKNECFRSYKNPEESYQDHSLFLTQRPRYSFLFELELMDYKAWASGLSKAGYATNPKYPELLIRLIDRYNLHHFDSLAIKKLQHKVKDEKPLVISHDFLAANPTDFPVVKKSPKGRFVHENNRRKLIFAVEGDAIETLASEFNIYSFQIVNYNEFIKKEQLKKGQIVYLEKKRRKSYTHKIHVLREGESLHAVSQLYGIRLSRIYKMNNLPEGVNPKAGTSIYLK